MHLRFYFEKLFGSEEFVEFKKEHKDAYFAGGFFALDLEDLKAPKNQNHLDYFSPSLNKFFSFRVNDGIEMLPIENPPGVEIKVPEKVPDNLKVDFDKIEDLVIRRIQGENPNIKVHKIILSLQSLEKTPYFLGTVFISGMGLVKFNLNLKNFEFTSFEKKSMMDMFNIFGKKKQ